MFFEVLSLTYHSPITIGRVTCAHTHRQTPGSTHRRSFRTEISHKCLDDRRPTRSFSVVPLARCGPLRRPRRRHGAPALRRGRAAPFPLSRNKRSCSGSVVKGPSYIRSRCGRPTSPQRPLCSTHSRLQGLVRRSSPSPARCATCLDSWWSDWCSWPVLLDASSRPALTWIDGEPEGTSSRRTCGTWSSGSARSSTSPWRTRASM